MATARQLNKARPAAAPVSSFFSNMQLRRLVESNEPKQSLSAESHRGAFLFLDLVSFTHLGEQLSEQGVKGAEVLSEVLHAYFEPILSTIRGHGGDVLFFAGDALGVVWLDENDDLAQAAHRAAQCGLAIQALVPHIQSAWSEPLAFRASLGVGKIEAYEVGGVHENWMQLVRGEAIDLACRADAFGKGGTVVLSEDCAKHLSSFDPNLSPLVGGYTRLNAIGKSTPPVAASALEINAEQEKTLGLCLTEVVHRHLYYPSSAVTAEFRKITVLFADISATDPEALHGAVQAAQKKVSHFEGVVYQLLEDDKGTGLECWPEKPRYEQISNAAKIKDIDLESYYSGYAGKTVVKKVGQDFDEVLFGIPISAVRFVCAELVENEDTPQWGEMVDNVKAVQTVAAQLWMDKDLHELGWETPQPLMSLFVEPFNTWADMSQVIDRENWPTGFEPRNIAYFTGAQPGPTDPPPPSDTGFQDEMNANASEAFMKFLKSESHNPDRDLAIGGLTTLWPNAASADNPKILDWSLLVDPSGAVGEARLDSQYCHSNCGPSERCTLALPGTNKFRMKAGETGYSNLVVTGDWTDNNLYLAFMEASFQAGILSARAIAGEPFPIIGEWLNK